MADGGEISCWLQQDSGSCVSGNQQEEQEAGRTQEQTSEVHSFIDWIVGVEDTHCCPEEEDLC